MVGAGSGCVRVDDTQDSLNFLTLKTPVAYLQY